MNCSETVQDSLIGLIRNWPIPTTDIACQLNRSMQRHLIS